MRICAAWTPILERRNTTKNEKMYGSWSRETLFFVMGICELFFLGTFPMKYPRGMIIKASL